MKKILFSVMLALMGTLVFTACSNDDNLGVDNYANYQTNFEKVFGRVNPNQNFNTQKTVTIQSTTGQSGNYTLRVYDGKPGKKSTSLLGQFENLSGNAVTPVKVDVSKSLKNIYCVADDGSSKKLFSSPVPASGEIKVEPRQLNPWGGSERMYARQSVTIAFEDLGSTDDFDFNDVVITVDYVNGMNRFDVTLQAVGGVLPVHLYFFQPSPVEGGRGDYFSLFDGKELHEVMGKDTKTMINTNWTPTKDADGMDNVAPVTETVYCPLGTIGEDGAPFLLVVDDEYSQGQIQITASTEAGKIPQVLVIGKYYSYPEDFSLEANTRANTLLDEHSTPYYWVWPKERKPINAAYPTITNWLQNDPSDLSFISDPDVNYIYDGYNPNGGGEEDPDGLVAVDLGLPSGTLWANMNFGAESVEDYGWYVAWGEIDTQWDDEDAPLYSIRSYTGPADSFTEPTHIAGTMNDIVNLCTGGEWMMPTEDQFMELFENTTYSWTTVNGVPGCKFTASNGKSIFLPAAGRYSNGENTSEETYGYYWADYYDPDNEPQPSWELFSENGANYGYENAGMGVAYYQGFSIRPVIPGKPVILKAQVVDLGLPSGTLWADRNVGATAPDDFGSRFAWGETATKDSFEEVNYLWSDAEGNYEAIGFERPDGTRDIRGDIQYDAAALDMQEMGDWAMPSLEQLQELFDECTFKYTLSNGIYGITFRAAHGGNTLFFPVCTKAELESTVGAGLIGMYWAGTSHIPYPTGPKADAMLLSVDKNLNMSYQQIEFLKDKRCHGNYIRAVVRTDDLPNE